MSENNNIVYAGLFKRVVSFFVDYTIITFARSLLFKLLLSVFLLKHIENFIEAISTTFGSKTTSMEYAPMYIELLFKNTLFIEILFVLFLIFAVGPVYYIILTKSKFIGTTFGRKIFNIYPTNQNGERPSWFRILIHYLASLVPVLLIIYLMVQQKLIAPQHSQAFFAIMLIFIISWYDLMLVTKKKIMMHDLIAGLNFSLRGQFNYDRKPKKSLFFLGAITKQIEKIRKDVGQCVKRIKNAKKCSCEKDTITKNLEKSNIKTGVKVIKKTPKKPVKKITKKSTKKITATKSVKKNKVAVKKKTLKK